MMQAIEEQDGPIEINNYPPVEEEEFDIGNYYTGDSTLERKTGM